MPRPNKDKKYLIDRYKQLVMQLYEKEGYDIPHIAYILNRDRTVIFRIVKESGK